MSEGSVEVYSKLSRALREPYSLAPILMTGGLIISIALTLTPRNIVSDLGLVTAILIAILGGLLELYYMILVSWVLNVSKGGGPSFKDILYALISIGLYYTLIGIAMLSLKVNEYSRNLACNCNSNILYPILTLGVHLAKSQTCLSTCASIRIEELVCKQSAQETMPEKL